MTSDQFLIAKESARQILSDNYIDNPGMVPLEHLAMLLGLFVRDGDLTCAIATLTTKEGKKGGIITVSKKITNLGQRRFSIAHEIGHFKLHLKHQPAYICTEEMFLSWYKANEQEPEANAFAAELLMPEKQFRSLIANRPPSKKLFDEMTEAFQTSLTATCARYAEVGPYPCTLFVSTDGKLKWVKPSPDMAAYFHIKIGSDLTAYSCAGDYFYNQTVEMEPQNIRYDAWFDDHRMSHDTLIFEYPIYLKNFNTVLSLVWLK